MAAPTYQRSREASVGTPATGALTKSKLTHPYSVPHPVGLAKRAGTDRKVMTVLRMQGIEVREQVLAALPSHALTAGSSFDGRNGKPSTRAENGPPLG